MEKGNRSKVSWFLQKAEKLLKQKLPKPFLILSKADLEKIIHETELQKSASEKEAKKHNDDLRKLNRKLKAELAKNYSSKIKCRKSLQEYKELYAYLQNVREEERINIARTIHDDLAQLLATLKIELTSWKAKTDKLDFLVNDTIDSQLLLVDRCMNAVSSVIMELRPVLLEKAGLIPALEKLFSDFQKRTGITCNMRIKEDVKPVTGEIAISVYRVVEEGLANIRNHSKASYVTTIISVNATSISITMKDNGIGISQEKTSNRSSFGIIGMKERVEGLKGSITFKGIPGKGTTMAIKVPLVR